MGLREMMADDVANVFTNPDEFGEAVVYVKRDGTTRTINARIDRNPPERVDGGGNLVTPTMTILVVNDATRGIAVAELDGYGADKVRTTYRGVTRDWGLYVPGPSAGEWYDAAAMTLDLK